MSSPSDLISLNDLFSYSNTVPPEPWQASTTYSLGNIIVDPAGHSQKCIVAGESGSTIPTFNDAGGTTQEGPSDPQLEWEDVGNSISVVAQEIIDGLSQAIYWACGRTVPMLTAPTQFTETYNGSGSDVLYLINAPIVSVASLSISGVSFAQSTGYGAAGWYVQQDQKSIALRSGGTGFPFPGGGYPSVPYRFARGRGNVLITYTAGYSGCPPDIYLLVLKQATIFLNKRLREDEGSHMIPASGQTNYRSWAMEPEVLRMLQPYTRTAMANIFGAR